MDDTVINSYGHRQSGVVGILLIIAGSLSIIIGQTWIHRDPGYSESEHRSSNDSSVHRPTSGMSWSHVATGWSWCSITVIVAGAFAIAAGIKKLKRIIKVFLIMAIVGAALHTSPILFTIFHYDHEATSTRVVEILGACQVGLCI